MSQAAPTRRMLEIEPLAAISLVGGAVGRRGQTRWALMLVWFCRLCSVLWLLAGLLQWAFIIGIIQPDSSLAICQGCRSCPPGQIAQAGSHKSGAKAKNCVPRSSAAGAGQGTAFEAASLPIQIATGFFAMIDIVAAVGLWLTAPWGSTVWLLSAAAQIVFPFALHDYGGANVLIIAVNTFLVVMFLLIKYMLRVEFRKN